MLLLLGLVYLLLFWLMILLLLNNIQIFLRYCECCRANCSMHWPFSTVFRDDGVVHERRRRRRRRGQAQRCVSRSFAGPMDRVCKSVVHAPLFDGARLWCMERVTASRWRSSLFIAFGALHRKSCALAWQADRQQDSHSSRTATTRLILVILVLCLPE